MNYLVKDYIGCKRCGLQHIRKNIVFGRGDIPCDVLFIGEAPGKSEDKLAKAFIGASGRLLNAAIGLAVLNSGCARPRMFITNVLACRPSDLPAGDNRQPTGEEAWACWPRLERTCTDARAQKVIILGKIAEQYCKKAFPSATCLAHPAYILRQGGVESPLFLAFWRGLSEVFKEIRHGT